MVHRQVFVSLKTIIEIWPSPEPAIDIWRGEKFSGRDPNFLNYVQLFSTQSNTFFQGVKNIKGGFAHTVLPSHGLALGDLILQTQIKEITHKIFENFFVEVVIT